MKTLNMVFMGLLLYVFSIPISTASEMVHEFKNPSFSGNGYSSHVLSIEQLQFNRDKQVKDDAKSAAAAADEATVEQECTAERQELLSSEGLVGAHDVELREARISAEMSS